MRIKILILVLLLPYFINAQDFDRSKMDSLFARIETLGKGMGSISIFSDGKEVYQKSYGFADIENGVKADAHTKYRIGSITKTFTASVVMKLIEEGKLSLASTLNDYYPQVKNSDKITIEHLLQHRSGISNFLSVEDYLTWNTDKQTKEQVMNRIISGGVSFEPDEKFEYSNSNYVLLTFIMEDVTGEKFPELLDRIIFSPCKLKDTYMGSEIRSDNNEAYSYVKLSDWKKESETDMSIPLGAGSIVSTPSDLNVFLANLFSGKIVTAESLKKMLMLKDNFGLGLFRVPFYDMTGYGHTGGIDGFQSNAFYFPENKVSVALVENGVVYSLNDIILGALSIYFGKAYELPEFSESIVLKAEDLDKYLGVYSTPAFPLKLTITKDDNLLIAQGSGQPSFPLECFEPDKFKFDPAKVELEFIPDENKLILKQNGMTFDMAKE
ncbi:MAG: beta-lactamase family protein [Tannerella sp.]|jgi:CubicO group peptidase (beta-lactamase class C family)|nr:beta-lactamase family protein [Tannerella sp.]